MTPFAIAGVQMPISAIVSNVDAMILETDLLMARFPWVQMVVFSELAPFGPSPVNACELPSDHEKKFQDLAHRHGIWLIPGSMFERDGDEVYNTSSVISPDGSVVARYRKIFPFYPYENGISSGDQFIVFDVPTIGRFGLMICYDLWFPEVARSLTALGAEVILHPVLTGTTDRDVEIAMARAAGAQFQSYIVSVNGLSAGGNGRSCMVNPSGSIEYQAGETHEYFPLEIDLDQVRRQREAGLRNLGQPLKSFRDRRISFPVYTQANSEDSYLKSLGPLAVPSRGSLLGVHAYPPIENSLQAQSVDDANAWQHDGVAYRKWVGSTDEQAQLGQDENVYLAKDE